MGHPLRVLTAQHKAFLQLLFRGFGNWVTLLQRWENNCHNLFPPVSLLTDTELNSQGPLGGAWLSDLVVTKGDTDTDGNEMGDEPITAHLHQPPKTQEPITMAQGSVYTIHN